MNAGVYLKGRVRGDALLTLSYDSDRDADAPGFRDLNPDDFFPIYGDRSVRAFDAQSSDKLYVKVEKDRSYALYGDFDAAAGQDHLKLGRHGRNLTGGKAHVERGRVAANVFAAREDHLRCVIEVPARGLSIHEIPNDCGEIVPRSERVEIVARDRRGVILRAERKSRFDDYSLGGLEDRIIFNDPIPARDDDGNPQFIRLTFERRGDGTRHWVRGGNARLRVSDGFVAGVVDSAEPENPLGLYSAWTTSRIGEDGTLTTEFAHSDSEREGNGRAGRVQYDHRADRLEIHLSAAQTAKSFDAPDAFLGAGRTEARAEVRTRLREGLWAETEGIHTENRIDGSRRTGVKAGIARQVSPSWSVLLRNRTALVDDLDGESDSLENRLRTGLAWRPAGDNRANALAWYEWAHRRDKANEDGHRAKHLWAVSADYRPTARLILNGGYAGKWSSQRIRKEASVSETHLLQQLSSRLTFDLTDRFDIGLAGSALFEGGFRNPVWRLGTEAGMVLQEDAWLSAGYNVLGYDEEDLGGGQHKGFYLRLRLKLDESLLGWLQ